MAHEVTIALDGRVCDDVFLTADLFPGDTGFKMSVGFSVVLYEEFPDSSQSLYSDAGN